MKDPMGKAAKFVLKATEPFIQMCGKKVPYSPMERDDAMGSLIAITQRFGTPSIFLTIAPDDTHNPMTLRICFPSKNNDGFPANPQGFLESLQQDKLKYDEHCTSEFSLQKLVTDNPYASTTIFRDIMTNLFNELLGIPLAEKNYYVRI